MSASQYDFSIEQGSSFRLNIIYKNKNGSIIDITNYCARLIWKTNTGIIYEFSTENNDLSLYSFTIDGSSGKIELLIPASVTNEYTFNSAKYDLELQSDTELYIGGGKEISRLLTGSITVIKRNSQSSELLTC